MKFIHEILCSICGNKQGEIQLSTLKGWNKNVSNDDLNIVDARCDSCESVHGVYADLVKKTMLVLEDPAEAEKFVKQWRKRGEIEQKLKKMGVFIKKDEV